MKDRTTAAARDQRVRSRLRGDESVLAAVAVQLPGTTAAALGGAATTATGEHTPSGSDGELAGAKLDAADFGLEGHSFLLVLTDARVLVFRRSAFGRTKSLSAERALADVDNIRVSKPASAVFIDLVDGRTIRFETPKAFKFLPPVYQELPERFAEAQSD